MGFALLTRPGPSIFPTRHLWSVLFDTLWEPYLLLIRRLCHEDRVYWSHDSSNPRCASAARFELLAPEQPSLFPRVPLWSWLKGETKRKPPIFGIPPFFYNKPTYSVGTCSSTLRDMFTLRYGDHVDTTTDMFIVTLALDEWAHPYAQRFTSCVSESEFVSH